MVMTRNELLAELRVVPDIPRTPAGDPTDVGYEFLRRVEDLRVKVEARKVDGRWEIFAAKDALPDDLKALCKDYRDTIIRAIWLKLTLTHLAERGVEYVPLAVEDDINLSHDRDDLDTFRKILHGWITELVKSTGTTGGAA